jgi:hypothetical protein
LAQAANLKNTDIAHREGNVKEKCLMLKMLQEAAVRVGRRNE